MNTKHGLCANRHDKNKHNAKKTFFDMNNWAHYTNIQAKNFQQPELRYHRQNQIESTGINDVPMATETETDSCKIKHSWVNCVELHINKYKQKCN